VWVRRGGGGEVLEERGHGPVVAGGDEAGAFLVAGVVLGGLDDELERVFHDRNRNQMEYGGTLYTFQLHSACHGVTGRTENREYRPIFKHSRPWAVPAPDRISQTQIRSARNTQTAANSSQVHPGLAHPFHPEWACLSVA
jgi:hypothetical protein